MNPPEDNTYYCSIAYDASQLAQDANAAYWLACEGSERAEFLRGSFAERLRSIADQMGYRVEEKSE